MWLFCVLPGVVLGGAIAVEGVASGSVGSVAGGLFVAAIWFVVITGFAGFEEAER